jgi:hypothetical protein
VRKAIGIQIIEEYKQCELSLYKQEQKLNYPHPDIITFNTIDFKTYLMNEKCFVYFGAMEIANKIDVP